MGNSDSSVLGVTYFGPVDGSPIIPPQLLTFYFIGFIILLSVLYFILYRRKQPITLWHKFKLLALAALAIKTFVLFGALILAAYWLIPPPTISSTSPVQQATNFSPTNKIEIIFDRPLSRSDLQKTISPEIPGRWVFENSLYTTHLYRKLVFYPKFSFKPNTTYSITLSNIRNITKFSKPYDHKFSFTTQNSPKVLAVTPKNNATEIGTHSEIKIALTEPNNIISEFDFELSPKTPVKISLDSQKKVYTLKAESSFEQGTTYDLKIKKTDVSYDLEDSTVVERGDTSDEYQGSFTTLAAPGVKSFLPEKPENIPLDSQFKLTFSKKMDQKSVEKNFSIEPKIAGKLSFEDETTVVFKPQKLNYETSYTLKIAPGTVDKSGGFTQKEIQKTFFTIGSVKVASFNPSNGLGGVNIHSPIKITFDQEVDKKSVESKFSLTPQISGTFSWNGDTVSFIPSEPFSNTTSYQISLAPGVKSVKGLDSKQQFATTFKTVASTTKLAVPAYLQKYSLSCELAALRMALVYRGVNVSEDTLIAQVGLDPTPHQGNIWGNPHQAFVGNVRGRQMVDGYGVHWEPIAKVAQQYRGASSFQGWSIEQLTQTISEGNPVVIWVYAGGGRPTTWSTPDGTTVYAVRDEHAVTAVGFVGSPQNPTQMIINDPLAGQVYWNRAVFDKKWNIFNRSGVVVN